MEVAVIRAKKFCTTRRFRSEVATAAKVNPPIRRAVEFEITEVASVRLKLGELDCTPVLIAYIMLLELPTRR